ncbi:MAG: flavodoxin-dependent (E)-4-hydroxy-3-methylbut-2-enyl-diphosphate synthase [Candidatus Zophobacter franzmannii]|jgi:(E)-4-hydroxy-3-methylbut-2-enyl-diphosphate synthase|nr:flavodoxin-dependent (E)-4-hydroxy-3-methylbut-2-enyl-diphosphate synthase [Candidatus Zophobacter franzmannii]
MIKRKLTKKIFIGDVPIGGDAPISIQSMTNTRTDDIKKTIDQINKLTQAGCDIVRCAVPDFASVKAIPEIIKGTNIPLIADIHFDYKLALGAIEAGVHGLRINPGNIGSESNVKEVVAAARERNIPIRIGVNAGSLSKQIILKYGVTPKAIVESALEHIRILEKLNYDQMKISVKSSDVNTMLESYRLLSQEVDYPLHLGITEAGTKLSATVKSSLGIGSLLADGIGDTIRVSLTGDPVDEIIIAKEILKCLELRDGMQIISCPTCGRTSIDLIQLAEQVEKALIPYSDLNLKIAVMGCIVNGPGEAREADFGIAGGNGEGLLFKKGEIVKKVAEANLMTELLSLIQSSLND